MQQPTSRRLVSSVAGAALLVGAFAAIPSVAQDREESLRELTVPRSQSEDEAQPHHDDVAQPVAHEAPGGADATDEHGHTHNDPATKNAISRSAETVGIEDPTTEEEARAHQDYVASNRIATGEPTLTTAPLTSPRQSVPEDRYAMAGGCYAFHGRPVFFQATDLGRYLLYGADRTVLAAGSGTSTSWVAEPSPAADWIVERRLDGTFTFRLDDGRRLRSANGTLVTSATATGFPLRVTTGCTTYPEITTNIDGLPHAGVTPFQEVRGYVDPHTHGMSHEFLGGRVICSPPWHRYGVAKALVDCPDHQLAGGRGAVLEDFLAGNAPLTGHDSTGWPTFGYWPSPHSLTHQGVYYKWLERSWRGGLRIFVNLLVENNVLCEVYPLKKNSCNDMDSIRLQAKDMRAMERYIDAQYGGPGEGWYRIVTTPFEAREVINQGKLAVVMGIETSVPFDCNVKLTIPMCSKATIDAGLDEVRALGVSQMEITNKFDNALTGVAGDSGSIGPIVNAANFYNTGSFWRMETCPSTYEPGAEDKFQETSAPAEMPAQDAIFGAIGQLFGLTVQPVPIYPAGPHCNQAGLTELGKHVLNGLIDRNMLFDPDHMSVKARKAALDLYEQAAAAGRHPGIMSSHSWSTPDAYPRIYKLGGFVAPYAGDSTGFLAKWRKHLEWADSRYYFGFGYGADMNGFGSQGEPRGDDVPNPVTYPFTGLNGIIVNQQVSGERVYDINADGVAHYGLYPDWIQDVKVLAGADGDAFASDMARGAEAYLQTWERAFGIAPDACRNPELRKTVTGFRAVVKKGMTTLQVMKAVGQPYTRLASTYGTCAKTATDPEVLMEVEFSATGKVVAVRRR